MIGYHDVGIKHQLCLPSRNPNVHVSEEDPRFNREVTLNADFFKTQELPDLLVPRHPEGMDALLVRTINKEYLGNLEEEPSDEANLDTSLPRPASPPAATTPVQSDDDEDDDLMTQIIIEETKLQEEKEAKLRTQLSALNSFFSSSNVSQSQVTHVSQSQQEVNEEEVLGVTQLVDVVANDTQKHENTPVIDQASERVNLKTVLLSMPGKKFHFKKQPEPRTGHGIEREIDLGITAIDWTVAGTSGANMESDDKSVSNKKTSTEQDDDKPKLTKEEREKLAASDLEVAIKAQQLELQAAGIQVEVEDGSATETEEEVLMSPNPNDNTERFKFDEQDKKMEAQPKNKGEQKAIRVKE